RLRAGRWGPQQEMSAPEDQVKGDETQPAVPRRPEELERALDAARAEVRRLSQENADLSKQLAEAKAGMQMDRAQRRAALNLVEDAVRAREAEQRENSERRRVEEELRKSNQLKDQFLATLAHELRNPLAPI